MRTFIGAVIMESLNSAGPLTGLVPVAGQVSEMPDDPEATVWHVNWYQVSESELRNRLPALTAVMRPHWYAHFWSDDDLCVILAGKTFWAKAGDKSTWQEFIAYGDTVGVERKWTETVPTTVPDWVQAALGSSIGLQGL